MRLHPLRRRWPASALVLAVTLAAPGVLRGNPASPSVGHDRHLVACAPGYPGSPAQAQPTLDSLAAAIAEVAGWPAGSLGAAYSNDADQCLQALTADADLSIVATPFLLAHGARLGLEPLAEAVARDGSDEVWSLVAARGKIRQPADLEGWEISGVPGYAPAFVRGSALAGWGDLPDSVTITFTDRVLGALRRALRGEPVAVLLDRAQTEALPSLPNGDALEIITRSEPMPQLVVAAIGDRLGYDEIAALRDGLLGLRDQPRFAELLASLRLSGFAPVDEARLDRLRAALRATS